jgi:predicted ester cyclase
VVAALVVVTDGGSVNEAVNGEAMTREPLLEEHKATYRRIIAAVSAGDGDALDALVAGDVVDHNPIPDQAPGLVGVKQWMVTARQSFPDLRGTVGHVVAEGDLVAGRVSWQGTQAGRFRGFAPTGRSVTFKAYHIVRFGGGRAVEGWGTADIFGVLVQLGEVWA